MPQYLRQVFGDGKRIRIGFFLHTVFPSSDFFRILPVRKDLLESLLHCDLIGFHNQDYTQHFLDCCTKILCVFATTVIL
jgi:trehalose 6-phosphate synthase